MSYGSEVEDRRLQMGTDEKMRMVRCFFPQKTTVFSGVSDNQGISLTTGESVWTAAMSFRTVVLEVSTYLYVLGSQKANIGARMESLLSSYYNLFSEYFEMYIPKEEECVVLPYVVNLKVGRKSLFSVNYLPRSRTQNLYNKKDY